MRELSGRRDRRPWSDAGSDVPLFTPGSRRRRSRYRMAPPWLSRKRAVLAMVALAALVAGTYGTRLVLSLGAFAHENPLAALIDLIRGKGNSDVQKQIDNRNRINIALYGYGGPGHDGPYLTDSIMVVSIQPRQGAPPQVAEISVPRDWYVPIQLGDGRTTEGRINEAYQDGVDGDGAYPRGPDSGPKVADATLERVLGIHIDHHVGVDFTAFESGVDAVGGVDVTVQNTFTDHQYPRGECGENGRGDCRFKTVHFNAGTQHMDGATALIFTRSRHSADAGEGSDFARSRRQQLVLQALKSRVVSVGGIGHLPDLLNTLSDHVVTDLKIGDAEALYDLVKDVDHQSIARLSLDDTNFLYDCGFPTNCSAAYLYAHSASFHSISRYIQHLFPDPAVIGEHAPATVIDAAGTGGGASGRWSGLLRVLGFSSSDGGQTRRRPVTHLIDDSGGRYPKTVAWLAEYFGVTVEQPTQPVAGGGIRLLLGQDEERVFNNSSTAAATASTSEDGWSGGAPRVPAAGRNAGRVSAASLDAPRTAIAMPAVPTPSACRKTSCRGG